MKIRIAAVMVSLMMIAVAVLAHGDKKHLMGVLEKVNPDSVSVKTADGKTVEIKLTATTVYTMKDPKNAEGTPAKVADLAVGQRVIIHATPKGNDLLADEVKFAPASPPTGKK